MQHRKFFVIAALVFAAIAVLRVTMRPTVDGRPLPEFEVEGWLNGELARNDLQGKVVVLDVWATW